MLPALLLLAALVPLSTPQCLTSVDEVRKIKDSAHEALLQSELQFSTDLLHTVSSLNPSSNVFFSPSSVFRALLMTYFLAANHTEANLKSALHLAKDQDKLDILGAYNLENYYQKLRSVKGGDVCQLSSANRMYVAKGLKTKACMKTLFLEEIQPADFADNLPGVVKKINQWVAGQTRNVIKDFLSEDSLSTDTQLVLVNAAYFKGTWKKEFNPEETHRQLFTLSNGTQVKTTMMTQSCEVNLRVDEAIGAEVLELPYEGDDVSMFFLLPLKTSKTALQDMVATLDGQSLKNLVGTMVKHPDFNKLDVTIPKFTLEDTLYLTPILESMGVGDVFQSTADFSTLTGSRGLSFTEAIHKAKIRVDEKGTEAAAATAIISSRMSPPSFVADHPFVYTLYDKKSNSLLFVGIFNSPTSN